MVIAHTIIIWLASVLRLATGARWSYLACSGLHAMSCKKHFPRSHIINLLLTKLVRSRWLNIGFASFLASLSRSIHMQERTWAILACVASNSVGLGTKEGPRNGIFSVGPCEKWCKSQISTHFDLTLGKWLIYKIFLPTSNNI